MEGRESCRAQGSSMRCIQIPSFSPSPFRCMSNTVWKYTTGLLNNRFDSVGTLSFPHDYNRVLLVRFTSGKNYRSIHTSFLCNLSFKGTIKDLWHLIYSNLTCTLSSFQLRRPRLSSSISHPFTSSFPVVLEPEVRSTLRLGNPTPPMDPLTV